MQIIANGINYSTGEPLIKPIDEQTFAQRIEQTLGKRAGELRELTRVTSIGTTFRDEVQRVRTLDLGDPRAAGWTFLVNEKDPQRAELIEAIRPLAQHRGMADPGAPLPFNDEPLDEWFDWLMLNYSSLNMQKVPHYILIVGDPDQVPFHFQAFLSSVASVGRVAFDSLDDLKEYVAKVIRLEKAAKPIPRNKAIFFGPEYPPPLDKNYDATYFSRRYLVEPLAEHVRTEYKYGVQVITGGAASKKALLQSLKGNQPALVYTASHGIGAPDQKLTVQKQVNGAICCQRSANEPAEDWQFTAKDVPGDEPFLEGSVFFQFACYGYGTPAESDYAHWFGERELNSKASFVAALPKRLLAHPRGPIGFVGHVDVAWLHGFDDPDNPHYIDRWHPRIEPFVQAIDALLGVQPVGLAMGCMSKRFDVTNAQLTSTYDLLQRRKIKMTDQVRTRLVQVFITRSDAQNYMVYGDPGARLRIEVDD